ncbi:hypothetical protein ACVPOY_14190 [Staphylococcus aureus]
MPTLNLLLVDPIVLKQKGSVESLAKFVEQRLRPYDYEFYDAVELIGLVNDLCH